MSKRIFFCLAACLLFLLSSPAFSYLHPLDDDQLSGISGQALIYSNDQAGTGASAGLTFYTMGLDAKIALNANIQKLQLGCGGANGSGACDIDINNASLTGTPGVNGCPSSGTTAGCDFVLTRPSITLAISNDGTPSRQVVGFQLSAQNAVGNVYVGDNTTSANGINEFSGYMTTGSLSGTAITAPATFGGKGCATPSSSCPGADPTGTNMSFGIDAEILGGLCYSGCGLNSNGTPYNFAVTDHTKSNGIFIASQSVPFTASPVTVNGNRQTSTTLVAAATINSIPLYNNFPDGTTSSLYSNISTPIKVCIGIVVFGTCVGGTVTVSNTTVTLSNTTNLTNLHANFNISEPLGFIHNIAVSSPFYLSFQKQAIYWPGAASADVAQRGWWWSFKDPISIGSVSPSSPVDISSVFPQVAQQIYNYMYANPYYISSVAGVQALLTGGLTANVGNIDIGPYTSTSPVVAYLSNLQLSSQGVPGNCFGSYRFC